MVVAIALLAVVVLQVAARGPGTTLWIYAHPDDETLTAAGAMLEARDEGRHVVVLVTDGEATSVVGEEGYPATAEALGEARQREARAALGIMEFYDVRFLGLQDGAVNVTDATEALRDVVRDVEPPISVRTHSTGDDYGSYGDCGHPDHCATARAALELHEGGLIDDVRMYRIEQFFDGAPGGTCTVLDAQQQAFKQAMRREYGYRNTAVGRYGIAESSVPGAWEATEVQPECFDAPAQ